MRLAKKHRIPFIHYWLDVYHTLIPQKYFRRIGLLLERYSLRNADLILTVNLGLRDRVIAMGAAADRTIAIRHGIDRNRFMAYEVSGHAAREQLGIAPDDIVLTYVGRLSKITGVREIVSEMANIELPNVKLLIVGAGSREHELRNLCETLSLQSKVILTGRLPFDEIPGIITATDVCLLPFIKCEMTMDIVPQKVLDYLGMGKPVVSTHLYGMVAEFGYDSGLFFVEEPSEILHKAIEVAQHEDLVKWKERILTKVSPYNWDLVCDELESIMLNLTDNRAD